jgi:predicted outer membrane protein
MWKSSNNGRWQRAIVGLASLGLTAAAAVVHAADAPYQPRGGRDQEIVTQLHQQNQAAIDAARIAEERATRDEVKTYASKVIRDRQVADGQLMEYAQGHGMNVPEIQTGAGALPHGPLATARLTTATPERFDGEFAAYMNARAQADIDQASQAQRLAQGPNLSALIGDKIVPGLADEQTGATSLAAALPPLPPPGTQYPGDPSYASWTNTGKDLRPGLAR